MDPQEQINMLKQQVEALSSEFHLNNFIGSQDVNKYVRYNDRLRTPIYATSPSTCEVGEIYTNTTDGKLYQCSAADTWTAVT